MMRVFTRFGFPAALIFVLILCLMLAGCDTPALPDGGSPSPSPQASPMETAIPAFSTPVPSDEEIAAAAREAFRDVFALDYEKYDTDRDIQTVTELMELRYLFTGMAADYEAAVTTAAKAAFDAAHAYDPHIAFHLECPAADWRFMVALCCDCAEKPEDKLLRLSAVEVEYAPSALKITVALPDFDAFFGNESGDVQYNALTIYSYLNTVYDINGNDTNSNGQYAFPEGYAATLVEPLPQRTLRPSWYNDRSNATRRHMGTDIRAPLGRKIHACGDGVVLYIGYTDIAGNYVVIKDDYGFRYTYCHFVEPTTHVKVGDVVKAGDIIGNVGSTGNSDAPHLHLSIITPEFVYVDPYPLMCEIRKLVNG